MLQVYDDARTWGQSLSWGWSSGQPPRFKRLHTHTCSFTCLFTHMCTHVHVHAHTGTHTHTHEGLVTGRSDGNTGQWCPGKSGLVVGWGSPGLAWAGPSPPSALPLPSLCPRWSLRRQGAHRVRIWSLNQGFESHLWPGDGRGPSACPAGVLLPSQQGQKAQRRCLRPGGGSPSSGGAVSGNGPVLGPAKPGL